MKFEYRKKILIYSDEAYFFPLTSAGIYQSTPSKKYDDREMEKKGRIELFSLLSKLEC